MVRYDYVCDINVHKNLTLSSACDHDNLPLPICVDQTSSQVPSRICCDICLYLQMLHVLPTGGNELAYQRRHEFDEVEECQTGLKIFRRKVEVRTLLLEKS
mmetsp:Transcript_6564/g.9812  ORF Transcript_6564/g.9812 Transcript_6564/m.9812 type:complete len:101 (-) Transcript_6564:235-537(-)